MRAGEWKLPPACSLLLAAFYVCNVHGGVVAEQVRGRKEGGGQYVMPM